jgi:hypothetical protein
LLSGASWFVGAAKLALEACPDQVTSMRWRV